jgi:hypothetical protein
MSRQDRTQLIIQLGAIALLTFTFSYLSFSKFRIVYNQQQTIAQETI